MKKIMKRALSLMLVIAMVLVPINVLGADGTVATLDSQTIENVVAGGTGEYYYLPDNYGTYTVTVTGEGEFMVGIYDVPMSPMPTKYTAEDGVVEKTITTSQMSGISSISLMVQNNSTTTQNYTVSVTSSTGSDNSGSGSTDSPDYSNGTGTQGNPVALVVGTTQTKTVSGSWDLYYYGWTADKAGTLTLTMDSACEYWLYSFHVNGIQATDYETMMSVYGDSNVFSKDVNVGDEVIIGVNLTDSNGTAIEGDVSFTTTFVETTGGSGDGNGEGENGDGNVTTGSGTELNPTTMVMGTNTAQVDGNMYYYTWTATETGNLMITMKTEDSPKGWAYDGKLNNEWFGSTWFTSNDADPAALRTLEVEAGDVVTFMVNTPTYEAGTVVFNAFFLPGQTAKETHVVDYDTKLSLGSNTVELDATAETTVFEFEPAEAGVYKFETAAGYLLGYWGSGTFFVSDQTVNKTNTLSYNLENVGPSIMLGVTGEGTCTVTITREGDAEGETQIEKVNYENIITPGEFVLEDTSKLEYVDIEDDVKDVAVLGEDGLYHLNAANGPVLFINLMDEYLSLASANGYGQLNGAIFDEEGNQIKTVEYDPAFEEYFNATGGWSGKGYYPLTKDLLNLMVDVGAGQGWYLDGSYGDAKYAEEENLFLCYYDASITTMKAPFEIPEGYIPSGDNGSTGGNTTGGTTTGGTTGGATTGGTTTGTTTGTTNTGDNANVAVWAILMVVAAGAAFVVAESKRRAR